MRTCVVCMSSQYQLPLASNFSFPSFFQLFVFCTLSSLQSSTSVEENWQFPMYTNNGPWGGKGGVAWDDEHIGGIRQMVIRHGAAIDSIQILYEIRGTLHWGGIHGGTGGTETIINLTYPDEFLVGVSGSWGDLQETRDVIRSLTFHTNKRIHGPYGEEQVTTFSYSSVGGKIVGFYGRSGTYLDAIGVHCEPPRARSCLYLFQPTSCCDTNVCCQCNWSVFRCF